MQWVIKNQRKYYLENIYDLLDLIVKKEVDKNFIFPINQKIEECLIKIFNKNYKYVGIAPGAGEKNKIWPAQNFIQVCHYLESKGFVLVFYLGPDEKEVQQLFKNNFEHALFLESHKLLKNFHNIEIIMTSTKFLKFALSNDSGVSHMLSTNHCPLIKLFGPKDSKKFTPKMNKLITIGADEINSNKIEDIKVSKVLEVIDSLAYNNV